MNKMINVGVCGVAMGLVIAYAGRASAQDQVPVPASTPAAAAAPTPAPAAAADTAATKPVDASGKPEEAPLKRVALTLSPLGLIAMRFSGNVDVMLATHHAVNVSPFYQSLSVGVSSGPSSVETNYKNFGGEVGYRYYSGTKGANGFFVGPSLVVQRTAVTNTSTSGASSASSEVAFTSIGGVIDLGGQWVSDGGFTLGGGFGLMYLAAGTATATSTAANGQQTSTTQTQTQSSALSPTGGISPRFLATIGYSF